MERLTTYQRPYALTGAAAVPPPARVLPDRILSLYAPGLESAAEALDLRPADAGANAILLEPVDEFVFARAREIEGLRAVALDSVRRRSSDRERSGAVSGRGPPQLDDGERGCLGAPDPLYVAARRTLLDALEAVEMQLDALVLVGAQAVYLHTGEGDLAVAPYTTDADLVGPTLGAGPPASAGGDPHERGASHGAPMISGRGPRPCRWKAWIGPWWSISSCRPVSRGQAAGA